MSSAAHLRIKDSFAYTLKSVVVILTFFYVSRRRERELKLKSQTLYEKVFSSVVTSEQAKHMGLEA